jgi:di/tricarboxylate transporter
LTLPQALSFVVIGGMMAAFVWGRFRFDIVAVGALITAVLVGIVPPAQAFSGFSDDIVIIVGSSLIISVAVSRSGVIDNVITAIGPWLDTTSKQIIALIAATALLSSVVKNVGALALFMPIAFHLARKSGGSPSCLLMPMAFASLLGGQMTLVGTSPNVVVSRMREQILGEPFRMLDFLPVGLGLTLAGLLFLAFGYRLLPVRHGALTAGAVLDVTGYTTEARVVEGSTVVGSTVAELEATSDNEVEVGTLVRGGRRSSPPRPGEVLAVGDVLILEGAPAALERAVAAGALKLAGEDKTVPVDAPTDEVGVVEGVVTPESLLVGRAARDIDLRHRFGVQLVAVSRRGERVTTQLKALRLRVGDVVVLQGNLTRLPEVMGDLGCLPLAERHLPLGFSRRSLLPVLILAGAVAAVSMGVPLAFGFFTAAALMVVLGALSLREAYGAVDWPILVLLGALIPVSESLRSTGATELVAAWLAAAAAPLPPVGALALVVLAAMAVTPFLNNAATVLVMAPIAAGLARALGLSPDPFLMAVAIGAASDFLTPIGHQCNTLVMGPGGYRFGDYWRLGLPLSLIVLTVAVLLIPLVWPLAPA